jgi:hypothetical protein
MPVAIQLPRAIVNSPSHTPELEIDFMSAESGALAWEQVDVEVIWTLLFRLEDSRSRRNGTLPSGAEAEARADEAECPSFFLFYFCM